MKGEKEPAIAGYSVEDIFADIIEYVYEDSEALTLPDGFFPKKLIQKQNRFSLKWKTKLTC